jgi:hypothetical protein
MPWTNSRAHEYRLACTTRVMCLLRARRRLDSPRSIIADTIFANARQSARTELARLSEEPRQEKSAR